MANYGYKTKIKEESVNTAISFIRMRRYNEDGIVKQDGLLFSFLFKDRTDLICFKILFYSYFTVSHHDVHGVQSGQDFGTVAGLASFDPLAHFPKTKHILAFNFQYLLLSQKLAK